MQNSHICGTRNTFTKSLWHTGGHLVTWRHLFYIACRVRRNDARIRNAVRTLQRTVVCSYPPFFEDDQPALFEAIKAGRYNFDPRDWGQISPGAKDLVSKILVVDPIKRYTSAEILAHPWMQADAATLPNVMLASTQQQLRQFNAKRKLRRAINGVRTAYRLKKMISKSSRAGTEASSADLTSDMTSEEASEASLAP